MDAQLMIGFRQLPEEDKKHICLALEASLKDNNHAYKKAVNALTGDGLAWLTDFWADKVSRLERK